MRIELLAGSSFTDGVRRSTVPYESSSQSFNGIDLFYLLEFSRKQLYSLHWQPFPLFSSFSFLQDMRIWCLLWEDSKATSIYITD